MDTMSACLVWQMVEVVVMLPLQAQLGHGFSWWQWQLELLKLFGENILSGSTTYTSCISSCYQWRHGTVLFQVSAIFANIVVRRFPTLERYIILIFFLLLNMCYRWLFARISDVHGAHVCCRLHFSHLSCCRPPTPASFVRA